ncbi:MULTISPECIES: amidase [Mesorhizobium]|uniref:Amidase family protein n=5 Tax=Phyllobacteriaceae TaxID=69277 RepID=A0ABZ0VJC1_9HYPH|nr:MULTISPECIES: amidase family protein [Mesorhizobium]MBZ9910142.1 amidase [Mesorhizobium sp. BR115XR7A]QGX80604.1 amidase [Mesorhizobium japonicum R7A]QJF04752.1 amidase [Mesorhizobium japonicum R7A]QJF10821.1 amidase [Mesorhizobium japonicum]QJI86694.1 amidase [Mesorhizobium japonicum]
MNSETMGFTPAVELAELVRSKKISPVEYMRTLLARITELEPKINAFAYLAADHAMDEAKKAEGALMSGGRIGRLHGVPVTIKDHSITKDMPTQHGSKIYAGHQPTEDAPLVQRLRAEGAIIIGKTTVPEMGWTGVSRSPLTGITSNPWKLGYNAGASSAGAGAAAAAGYGPLHQGSDGAGSIRMPAHFCGIYGLKPSFGRIPNYPVPGSDMTTHNGPMTRTVADAALMTEVMAGPHSLDHTTLEAGPASYLGRMHEGIKGRRIAYSPDLGFARVDPEVAELVKAAAARFTELGAVVEEVPTPWAKDGPELIRFFWSAHLTGLAQYLPKWEAEMDPGLVACIKHSENVSVARYQEMRYRKMTYVANIHRWFQDWDLLLTPSASVAAFQADKLMPDHWPTHAWDWIMWAEFSYPFNMSWNPAASVPCGFTPAGLPVGLQIVGKRFDDLGVLQASAAFEQLQPWKDKRPRLSTKNM